MARRPPANNTQIVIKSHIDALNYMIDIDQFRTIDAVAAYLMQMNFLDRLLEKQKRENRKMSAQEIDEFADYLYSIKQLDEFKLEAINRLKNYNTEIRQKVITDKLDVYLDKNKKFKSIREFNKAAWYGVAGNFLFLALGVMILLGAKFVKSDNNSIVYAAAEYYNQCVSPFLSTSQLPLAPRNGPISPTN